MMREKLRRRRLSDASVTPVAWWLVFCSLIVALGAAAAHAGDGRALRGLKSVALVIERLDPESRNCGIDDASIKDAITAALANSRLKLSAQEVKASLSVTLTTLYDEDTSRCASHIELEVYDAPPAEAANRPVAKTVLWSSGALIIAEQERYRERLKLALAERANQLVIDWAAAQR
jgi:hypothetical protein